LTFADPMFTRRVTGAYGDEGARWLERLPTLTAECRQQWHLTPHGRLPFNYRYVEPVRTRAGAAAVLKLGPPDDPEHEQELDALEWFAGRGGVRVLALDRPRGAALLERLQPGTQLRTLVPEDDERATGVAATVMRRLWRPPPARHRFPYVRDWGEALTGRPAAMYAELAGSMGEPVVLHGDLHHENILHSGDDWIAIDASGVIGEREFETGALLRNPYPELLELPRPRRTLARRAAQLAEELALDHERIRAWAHAQAHLAAAWTVEEGEDPAYWLACADLLA
jgi:streptomycin 6-kinase